MAQQDDLDDYIDAAARVLALPLAEASRSDVKAHLAAILALGALVDAFPLADEAEPAPVYRA
jgi:hypothetical protein